MLYPHEGGMLLPAMTYYDTESGKFVSQTIMQTMGVPVATVSAFMAPELKVKKLTELAKLPTRSNADDAGMDFYATESVTLKSRLSGFELDTHGHFEFTLEGGLKGQVPDPTRVLIPTGISVEIPQGFGLFLWDRSGLAAKNGIHRVAGVIDSSYRGEIRVALINLSNQDYHINVGDKIIQGILMPTILPRIVETKELSDTVRGQNGFGSSGK